MQTKSALVLATALVALTACVPVQVGNEGLSIYDLRYESNYRDTGGKSYICDNKITTLTVSFAYTDFNKIAGWEAQLIGQRTGAVSSRLIQTRNGGGFRLEDNHVVVNWVLAEGLAPQSIVVTPIPQPKVVGSTSLELLVRATDGGSARLRFAGIPVVDNCN
jgi:hypothetical protein